MLPGRLYGNTTSSPAPSSTHITLASYPNNRSPSLVRYLIPSASLLSADLITPGGALHERERASGGEGGRKKAEKRKGFVRIRVSFDLCRRVCRMTASINHLNGSIDEAYEPSGGHVCESRVPIRKSGWMRGRQNLSSPWLLLASSTYIISRLCIFISRL
jgi:hypothetical protein